MAEIIVDALKAVWMGFCDVLAPLFEGAFSQIATILSTVLDVLTGLFDVFIGLFTGDWSQTWEGEIFGGIWDGITGLFSNAMGALQGVADTVLGWFGTSWEEVWGGISSFFTDVWNNITDFFSGTMENIKSNMTSTFTSLVNSAYSWGKDICTQMSRGISANSSAVINQAKSLAQSVKNIVGFSVPKEGPLSDADEYMPDFMELMARGIRNSMGSVLDDIEDVAASIRDAMIGDFEFPEWNVPELALANAGSTTTNNNRTTNLGGIQIVVNGYNVQNDDQLADMVAAKINESINREEAVFR